MIFRHNVRLIVLGIAGIICCLLAAPAMTQALDVPAFTVSRFVATKGDIRGDIRDVVEFDELPWQSMIHR